MKTLLRLPTKKIFFKRKRKKHTTSQGINEDLHGYAYLFHVNSMPGYSEDQDTSKAKEIKYYITAKGKEIMITYYQESDGQTQKGKRKTLYQKIDKTSNITVLCKIKWLTLLISTDH